MVGFIKRREEKIFSGGKVMLIKLENGVIINTNQIVAIFGGCAFMTSGIQETYFSVTDKDIENIMMSQQPFMVLSDGKLEDMGGIFKEVK
jgi:hypothetical protein